METERLLRLADFLETVPPSKFNMEQWLADPTDWSRENFTPEELEQECGTSACAAGWACVLFRDEGLGWWEKIPWFASTDTIGSQAMMDFFSMGDDDAQVLFGAISRTPTEEANLIRRLVAESGS